MRLPTLLVLSTLALSVAMFAAGCAATPPGPTPEARQALAPTGKLRVAMMLAANHATKDPATGEMKGIAVDLGREVARRIGVPFEPVGYSSFGALWAGLKAGDWDMATMGITQERAKDVDFTRPYMEVEFTYLVPAGIPASMPADLDKPGISIAVLKGASTHAYLARALRHASVLQCTTVPEMLAAISTERAQALFGTRAGMLNQVAKLPGSRVMDASFGGEETAVAVPKGQLERAAYMNRFLEDAKSNGLVKAAIERSGTKGLVVAPLGPRE